MKNIILNLRYLSLPGKNDAIHDQSEKALQNQNFLRKFDICYRKKVIADLYELMKYLGFQN